MVSGVSTGAFYLAAIGSGVVTVAILSGKLRLWGGHGSYSARVVACPFYSEIICSWGYWLKLLGNSGLWSGLRLTRLGDTGPSHLVPLGSGWSRWRC